MQRVFVILMSLAAIGANAAEELYPGYTWQRIGAGIFLHSQSDPLAGPIDGNSVIIVNDDGVVVVDTHINPAVTRAVVAKIRSITDVPVTHVINTHWHDDHTNGNYVYRREFPDASILAHRATLQHLREEWEPLKEQRQKAYAEIDLDELQRMASDPVHSGTDAAIAYRVYGEYVAALRPELPSLVLEYPNLVFNDDFNLRFGARRIEVKWLGRGNTHGDAVVWLPDDGLLITGDLLVAPIPFAFDSPMQDWIGTLERIAEIEAAMLVPGHGTVMHDDRYLKAVLALLKATVEHVRAEQAAGVAFEALAASADLDALRGEFAGDDPQRQWAWTVFYLNPGLKSAWQSLGYALPDD